MAMAMAASQGSSVLRSSFSGEKPRSMLHKSQGITTKVVGKGKGGVRAMAASGNFDHIPKQFRGEGLKEGLEENFKTLPRSLYGLNPRQMDMFMTEDSVFKKQADRVTEATISSARNYQEGDYRMNEWNVFSFFLSCGTTEIAMKRGGLFSEIVQFLWILWNKRIIIFHSWIL